MPKLNYCSWPKIQIFWGFYALKETKWNVIFLVWHIFSSYLPCGKICLHYVYFNMVNGESLLIYVYWSMGSLYVAIAFILFLITITFYNYKVHLLPEKYFFYKVHLLYNYKVHFRLKVILWRQDLNVKWNVLIIMYFFHGNLVIEGNIYFHIAIPLLSRLLPYFWINW